ncbi:TPA: ATP-dependent helicase [Candidatus Bipolaricaulota bacterium]|nr:ATP-dependent helicase [Candidatus Bipolaricaulota bacterium]
MEERVRWLLSRGTPPEEICVVSFTRASVLDLRGRIQNYCSRNGQPTATRVRVSTLHSLALRTLRAAGLLTAYPSDPLVLDSWEVETIFDGEFRHLQGIGSTRCKEIRRVHEAFWSTGQWGPPNYIPPNPPISNAERNQFQAFHGPRTQTYSCVLPGEIVRRCVQHMRAGTLDPVTLLNLRHLIVDEYQDLNPMDLEFVDLTAVRGAILFVAGDDDQSIYSFRYASPSGIQNFTTRYPNCGQHALSACFRCTPSVLAAGLAVMSANPGPNRIPKNHVSLYAGSNPPVQGVTHFWNYPSGVSEARSIATSCRDFVQAGINPRDILVLLSNTRTLWPVLSNELQNAGVPFKPPRSEGFLDSKTGRLVLSLLRIVCAQEDYVAHRNLLGLLPGVGVATCNAVCEAVITNNLNYRYIFYQPPPAGVFSGRAASATNRARGICSQISTWQDGDAMGQRIPDISRVINDLYGQQAVQEWESYASSFPAGTTLQELRDLLWADTDEQQASLLQAVYDRLNQPIPTGELATPSCTHHDHARS